MAFSATNLDRITCVNNKLWYVYDCMFNPKERQKINRLLFYLYQQATRAARVLDIVLSSQKEFVDNVVIQEPLGSSDHNQLHFNLNIKSDKTKVKQCRRDFRRGNYDDIRKSLALIDWNDKMNNKTAT